MKCFFLLLLTCTIIPLSGQVESILPKDEAKEDASLAAFVLDLKKAILIQDENWILSVLDDDVVSSFGDEPGKESFMQYWAPEGNETSFWNYLKRVVDMGGVFLHDPNDQSGRYQFVFPYVYATDVTDDEDYYWLGAVTGKNVNLRAAPDTKSTVVTQLSYNLVYYQLKPETDALMTSGDNPDGSPMWFYVKTRDKKHEGWINWQYVYPVGGPRLFLFKNADDQWKISAFVAGD